MIDPRLLLGALLTMSTVTQSTEFTLRGTDGVELHGVVDRPAERPIATVVMSSGTGLFDRDVRFGRSGTEHDLLFKDLSSRLTAVGLQVVRFDRRGVNYGNKADPVDWKTSARITNDTLRDDLGTVYDWVRSPKGLAEPCVVVLGHSEGVATIARLAETGRPAPALIVGFGALLESPETVLRWQLTKRDVTSLERMDVDRDGVTTNEEVHAHWRETPSAAFDMVAPFLNPNGSWDKAAIAKVGSAQTEAYEKIKNEALGKPDGAPYPDERQPMAAFSWWKSWFNDATPVAERLRTWKSSKMFFYGDRDSQTPADRQTAAARKYLSNRTKVIVLPGLGHSLGDHVLFGPIDPAAGESLAQAVAREASRHCSSR